MTDLLTAAWWIATTKRAAYTALAAALPYLALLLAGTVTLLTLTLVVALAVVASVATSLVGLPEVTGTPRRPWVAVLVRGAKTAGQTLLAGIGGAVLLTDVDWRTVLVGVVGAVATTVGRALLAGTPEASGDTGS